jgi:hypothetical protein
MIQSSVQTLEVHAYFTPIQLFWKSASHLVEPEVCPSVVPPIIKK